ncbi:hypothetical protein KR032_012238, partial [Drosophila birchii]
MDPPKNPVKRCAESSAKVPEEVKFAALEVKIVEALACNDVVKRNAQVRKLPKWFELRATSFPFNEEDLKRIWKGLYYTMWKSDKPIVQEELAERLAHMVDSFGGNTTCSLAYFSAFMRTMSEEFSGIDQWRMDKFLMLVRRMLRHTLRLLKQNTWSVKLINAFNHNMQQSVLCETPQSHGLTMHYLDIFIEELAKMSDGDITAAQVNIFLRPFVTYMAMQSDAQLVDQCRTRVLYHLLYQSDLGRAYTEKNNASKLMGFPTIASIESNEKINEAQEEVNSDGESPMTTFLDPRTGNVDLLMPVLPLNADCVLDELQTLLRTNEFNISRRKSLRKLVKIFETYKGGEFPLGVRTMSPNVDGKSLNKMLKEKVAKIKKMEDEVFSTGKKLKKLSKSKRKQLLQVINYDEVDEQNYDDKAVTVELDKIEHNAKMLKQEKKLANGEPAAKKSKRDKQVNVKNPDASENKKKKQAKCKKMPLTKRIKDEEPSPKLEQPPPKKPKKIEQPKT